jgi:prepilin-type N-terminal cleavage/methylation domain-containing protein
VNYRIQPSASAFSLIEILVVLAIITLLVAIAAPSWRAQRNQALTNEARIVLERLDLKQRQFMLRHARYASAREMPLLQNMSTSLIGHYRLEVLSDAHGYVLQLIGKRPGLPALALNHLGVFTESNHAGAQ